jgi:CRISP-associated protein Cas1
MRLKDLRVLPKMRDSLSYLYVEHRRVDREEHAIGLWDANGLTAVPCANLTLLMLGPGTRITHAAITTLADNGCMVAWTGEEGVRFYPQGLGETRSARGVIRQAGLVSDPVSRLEVVRKMYAMRFAESPDPTYSLPQLRGLEGVRVRQRTQEPVRKRAYHGPGANINGTIGVPRIR